MQGIIYVRVALYLECDATEEEVKEIVDEMDYDFQHPAIQEMKIEGVE